MVLDQIRPAIVVNKFYCNTVRPTLFLICGCFHIPRAVEQLQLHGLQNLMYSLSCFLKKKLPTSGLALTTPGRKCSLVAFSHEVMSDSLRPHGLQHASPFPVLQYYPEFVQTHVHWVSDAIQPSYPRSPPSPPALNLSQHQGLFYCISSSHHVAKVLGLQLQHQSFQWTFRADFL